MLDLIESTYLYGACATWLIIMTLIILGSINAGEPVMLSLVRGVFLGIIEGIIWPLAALLLYYAILSELQAEHGIFWKGHDWKPESERILDILRKENREMRAKEICQESSGHLHTASIYTKLEQLERKKLISSREETQKEADARHAREGVVPTSSRPVFRRRLYKITDQGRRRRVKRSVSVIDSATSWLPLPA